jgi:hypothetical protein
MQASDRHWRKGYDGYHFRESTDPAASCRSSHPDRTARCRSIPTIAVSVIATAPSRFSQKLKHQRRVSIRYDKTFLTFKSFLDLVMARLRLKSFGYHGLDYSAATAISLSRACIHFSFMVRDVSREPSGLHPGAPNTYQKASRSDPALRTSCPIAAHS